LETFILTRREAAALLLALQGKHDRAPLAVLQEAWVRTHKGDMAKGGSLVAFLSTALPPVFEKMIKQQRVDGFSLSEIVSLGNQIEYTNFSVTSVQNWVKRDFKEFLGSPKAGKKYSIEQAAMLFIIEDLKSNLDFESIRKMFHIIFRSPDDETDDLMLPVQLFWTYSALFEELDENNDQLLDVSGHDKGSLRNHDILMEQMIRQKTDSYVEALAALPSEQKEALRNMLVIALVSVQTSFFNSLARRYLNATLFLHTLR